MQVDININQDDLSKIKKSFKNLEKLDESQLLEAAARPIENSTRDSFEDEKDPWGNSWANQSSKTYNHLDSTDHNLQGSLHSTVNSGKVTVGFNAVSDKGYPYAAVHQFGSKKSSGRGSNIPARPFMPIDIDGNLEPTVEKEIIENIEDFLEELID